MCLGQDRRDAAPQTPLRKVQFVGSEERFALASQRESICGLGVNTSRLIVRVDGLGITSGDFSR
jgi:hypothetical protein